MERGRLVEQRLDGRGVRATRSIRTRCKLLGSRPQRVVAAGRRRRAAAGRGATTSASTFSIAARLVRASDAFDAVRARDACSCAAARRSASSANRARARRRSAWRCSRCSRSRPATVTLEATSRLDDADRATLRAMRRRMQVVFQDPFASLSPRMTIGQIVGEGVALHMPELDAAERDALVLADARRGRPVRRARRRRRAAALSARVLGRPAPAHRDRARGRAAPGGAGARRADLGARRLGAAAGARSCWPSCSAATA